MKKIILTLFILPLLCNAQNEERRSRHKVLSAFEYSQWVNSGRLYLDSLNYKEAILDFSTAIYLEPEEPAAYFFRSQAFEKEKEYLNAIEDLTKLIWLDPNEWYHYLSRGLLYYYFFGNYDSALNDLSKSIELNPDDEDLYVTRGGIYADKQEFDKACTDYNYALKLGSTDSDVIDFIENNCK